MKPSTKTELAGRFHEAKGHAKEKVSEVLSKAKAEAERPVQKVASAAHEKIETMKKAIAK